MTIKLTRQYQNENCTHGSLFINNNWSCFTLEDIFRQQKLQGKTRIPAGRYKIKYRLEGRFFENYSVKFKDDEDVNFRGMFEICDVPNYKYILIHIGNSSADTEGCILVGMDRRDSQILNSTIAYKKIYNVIADALDNEDVYIDIVDGDR
jgi:hypothetical protein